MSILRKLYELREQVANDQLVIDINPETVKEVKKPLNNCSFSVIIHSVRKESDLPENGKRNDREA